MGRITARTRVTRVTVGGTVSRRDDLLAVEEPLELRVGGTAAGSTRETRGTLVKPWPEKKVRADVDPALARSTPE